MTVIKIKGDGRRGGVRHPKMTTYTFVQRDVAMAFLAALFVRYPGTDATDLAINGDEIHFTVPGVVA